MNPTNSMQDRDPFPSCVKHISPYYPRFTSHPRHPYPLSLQVHVLFTIPETLPRYPIFTSSLATLINPTTPCLPQIYILFLLTLGNSLRFTCESVYLVDTLRDSCIFYPVCCSIMNLAIIRHNHCVRLRDS